MKVKFTAELIDERGNKIVKEIEREIPKNFFVIRLSL